MNENVIRLSFFFVILLTMLFLQIIVPRRKNTLLKSKRRKINNLILVLFNSLIIKIIFPVSAVMISQWCTDNNIGILNVIEISNLMSVALSFLILDLCIYLQHVLFHFLPILWRIHRVHHADMEYDVTTGLRFHPIEIILSMLIKIVVIISIGAPVLAVIIFEIILNATAMFNHSNIKIPKIIDKALRYFVVTPDMHRVHHSVIRKETNSNFSFNLPIWDRIFRTYIKQPKYLHNIMKIGLCEFGNEKQTQDLIWMLKIPFFKK